MKVKVKMPKLGLTMTQGKIEEWKKVAGDQGAAGDGGAGAPALAEASWASHRFWISGPSSSNLGVTSFLVTTSVHCRHWCSPSFTGTTHWMW